MTVTTDAMVIGTVTDYGDQALLLEFDSTAEVLAWNDVLRRGRSARRRRHRSGLEDGADQARRPALPGAPPASSSASSGWRRKPSTTATAPIDGRADVVIDVVYDGADLDEVATADRADAARRRRRAYAERRGGSDSPVSHRVSRYLVGGDERLNVPRRSEPRTKVPAGLGRPGRRVQRRLPTRVARRLAADRPHRRRVVGRRPRPARPADAGAVGSVQGGVGMTTTLEVLRTGPLALVEDLGRPRHGTPRRDAVRCSRPPPHKLANRLVANPGDRATVEVTFGGFSARVRGGDVAIAVTGADTDPAVNGVPFGTNSIHYAHDGAGDLARRAALRAALLSGDSRRHRRRARCSARAATT